LGPLWNQGSEGNEGVVSQEGSQVESVEQPDTSTVAHATSAINALRERGLALTSGPTVFTLPQRRVPMALRYPQPRPAR
jgi:hypothetical protein